MDAATATLAERWQALEQLRAAYGQPSGNMFFTYNGSVYRSIGVNGDGTLRVVNQETGANYTLDPVDVYTGARAASGDPVPAKPTPPIRTGNDGFSFPALDQIQSYSGFGSLLAQGASAVFKQLAINSQRYVIPNIISNANSGIAGFSNLDTSNLQFDTRPSALKHMPFGKLSNYISKGLAVVGVVLGAVSVFQSINGMFKTGKVSVLQLVNIGTAALGIAMGVNSLMGLGFMASLSAGAGWATAGAVIAASIEYGAINSMFQNGVTPLKVVLASASFMVTAYLINLVLPGFGLLIAAVWTAFSILWSYFHKPDQADISARHLSKAISPLVWTPGPLAIVAVGTAAILMGWAKGRTPPVMASLTVPAYTVNQVLASQGTASVPLNSKTPSVLVEPGDGKVVIVTPKGYDGHGNPLVSLQSYSLEKDLQFISSPHAPVEGTYIPFFLLRDGKIVTDPNPDILNALNIQDKMLQSVLSGALTTHDAMNALNIALSANKYGVNPAY